MFFSCLLKSYGPNLQNDSKLEPTSCFIAEKMALDESLFCTGSLWEAFYWCESFRKRMNLDTFWAHFGKIALRIAVLWILKNKIA